MFKRLKVPLIVVIVLLALLSVAASPLQGSPPVPEPLSVPEALGLALTSLIGFLLVNGLKSFSVALQKRWAWFPDLSNLSAVVATAVVTTVILFVNTILGALPVEIVPIVKAVGMAITAILGAYGIHYTLKGFQWPGGEVVVSEIDDRMESVG